MNYIEQTWVKNADSKIDFLEYLRWFDDCDSIDDYVKNGFIDFTHKIFTPDFYDIILNPKTKKCLEIGCGAGRMLNAAAKFFSMVYGVDILNKKSFAKTEKFLSLNATSNFKLMHRDQAFKDIKDNSIDFVYSFIVFQHFASWKEVELYFDFINRVLSKSGAGIIYFGRSEEKDIVVVKDTKFKDRQCSLYVSKKYAYDYIKKRFTVLEVGEVTKTPWNKARSGQFYVKFKR